MRTARPRITVSQPDCDVIPLATVADPHQVEVLRSLLVDRRCVVIGSAPLSRIYADIESGELVLPVNGGIASVLGDVDLWVIGSKPYDNGECNGRHLHWKMLDQAKRRTVKRALFLRGPKHASEKHTLARLEGRECKVQSYSVLDKPTKRWLEGELCARSIDTQPCSSGILAAAIACYCGAARVRLVGFSFKPGYHYVKQEQPQKWWRDHVDADTRALKALRNRYALEGDVLRSVAA